MSDKSGGKRRLWPTPRTAYDGRTMAAWRTARARMDAKRKAGQYAKGCGTPGMMDLQRAVTLESEIEMPPDSSQPSMFSAEDFPVSRIPPLAGDWAPPTIGICGPNLPVSFASLDRDGSWLKTSQGCCQLRLDGSLEAFCETWPRAGMTRNGIAYLRQPSAPLTGETECGSWPTPTSRDYKDGPASSCANVPANGLLGWVVHQWPTPTIPSTTGGRKGLGGGAHGREQLRLASSSEEEFKAMNGGSLNPTWVEWLMGYPLGWTDCAGWETRLSRKSRNGSRSASSRPKDADA
jgi:hypothetical protein